VPLDAILPKMVPELTGMFAIDVLEDKQSHGKSPPVLRVEDLFLPERYCTQ
jgi:hypothetical protein